MGSKISRKLLLVMLVLSPLIVGGLIEWLFRLGMTSESTVYFQLASILHVPWMYGGGMVIWFFAGMAFGNQSLNNVKSFILGNTLWGILLSLYIWQLFLEITSRNSFIMNLADFYVLGFLGFGVRIVSMFTNNIQASIASLIAYFLMLAVFSTGFYTALKIKPSEANLQES